MKGWCLLASECTQQRFIVGEDVQELYFTGLDTSLQAINWRVHEEKWLWSNIRVWKTYYSQWNKSHKAAVWSGGERLKGDGLKVGKYSHSWTIKTNIRKNGTKNIQRYRCSGAEVENSIKGCSPKTFEMKISSFTSWERLNRCTLCH